MSSGNQTYDFFLLEIEISSFAICTCVFESLLQTLWHQVFHSRPGQTCIFKTTKWAMYYIKIPYTLGVVHILRNHFWGSREQTEILLNDQNHAWVFSVHAFTFGKANIFQQFQQFHSKSDKFGHSGLVYGKVGFAQISVKDAKAIVWRYFLHVFIDLVFDICPNLRPSNAMEAFSFFVMLLYCRMFKMSLWREDEIELMIRFDIC